MIYSAPNSLLVASARCVRQVDNTRHQSTWSTWGLLQAQCELTRYCLLYWFSTWYPCVMCSWASRASSSLARISH